MNRGTHLRKLISSKEKSLDNKWHGCLEPLEDRKMLAAVTWDIDETQSFVQINIPDQNIMYNVLGNSDPESLLVRIRNTPLSENVAWTEGNSTTIDGTLATDYVDGSTIQFLSETSNMFGSISGNYIPNPADWVPPVEDDPETEPDESADGYYSTEDPGPGVIGGRIYVMYGLLNASVAWFNFSSMDFEALSDEIAISGGEFAAGLLTSGIKHADVDVKGIVNGVFGQILDDDQTDIDNEVLANQDPGNATIIAPDPVNNPNLRQMTIPYLVLFDIDVAEDAPVTGTITGQVVATTTLGVEEPNESSVVNRRLFYNQSQFDGNNIAANASDSNAIPDKSAYFAGDGVFPVSATTSYSKGINGVIVDLQGTHGEITPADFTFRMSNQGVGGGGANNSADSWVAAPTPTAVVTLPDSPSVGTDRVLITWANEDIKNRFLQINVNGNDTRGGNNTNTGLAETDVFYFGNKVGDTFTNSPVAIFQTSAGDEIELRGHFQGGVTIDNVWDIDHNKISGQGADQIATRGANFGVLTRISIPLPSAPEAAPAAAGDGGGSAIASALALQTSVTDSLAVVPSQLVQRLEVGGGGGSSSKSPTQLEETRVQANLASDAGSAVDEALDDELLESLLD